MATPDEPIPQLNREKLDKLVSPAAGPDTDLIPITRGALRILVRSDVERRRLQAFAGVPQLDHARDIAA